MSDLAALRLEASSGLVFLDDFSGTGDHLVEWWQSVEPLVRPVGGAVVVALLVLGGPARPRLEQFAAHVLSVDELHEDDNVFSETRRDFDSVEKERLLVYCRSTGCAEHLIRGYGSSGLLLVFKHGCPNNSLPILWCGSEIWQALFKRRAI